MSPLRLFHAPFAVAQDHSTDTSPVNGRGYLGSSFMRLRDLGFGLAAAGFAFVALAADVADNDPNYWLTDIWGAKQIAWVKERNSKSEGILKSDPYYAETRAALL